MRSDRDAYPTVYEVIPSSNPESQDSLDDEVLRILAQQVEVQSEHFLSHDLSTVGDAPNGESANRRVHRCSSLSLLSRVKKRLVTSQR